jgi:CheY-like chemotaxis protein
MSERYCILCVDDKVRGLEARAALLEEEGYSVTSVNCPLRALDFDVAKFHLAVLDFAMPTMKLAAKDSKRAADLASIRFKNGATGLLDLLDAQRAQLRDEDAYAESHSGSALSAVILYESLAGGWPQRPPHPRKKTLRRADTSSGVERAFDHLDLNALQLSKKGHLCLHS